MLAKEMLADMCCPTCREGDLRTEIRKAEKDQILEADLLCDNCGISFPVSSGIPNFIPQDRLTSEEWKMWQDHLDGFQARREERIENPERKVNQWGNKSKPQEAFSIFTGIREGTILDLGCGPGKFRFRFDSNRVKYYGLDPIVLPEVEDFPFVRALAEYIPFKDNTFTDLVVLAALDHFRELDTFFVEAMRVLKPKGRIHILQSIHEIKGPASAVKMLSHSLKDMLEDRQTKIKNPGAPKHITEFSQSFLFETLNQYFEITAVDSYSHKWYSPSKLFVSVTPRNGKG